MSGKKRHVATAKGGAPAVALGVDRDGVSAGLAGSDGGGAAGD